MEKTHIFLVIVITVFVLSSDIFAWDSTGPVVSGDSTSVASSQRQENKEMVIHQKNHLLPQDDELDESFLEEYDNSLESQSIADPLYCVNYAMYSLNDILYFTVINPLASAYNALVPTPVRKGVKNFFHNLVFPIRLVNNLLQGKIAETGTEIEIFLINSTLGGLGFCQVAQNTFDLNTSDEDLGQTLGSYSIGNGCYLVLPILGPSTLRDTMGLAGDYFLTPVNYLKPWEVSTGIKACKTLNAASFHLGEYEAFKASAIDPYMAIKNAYIQNRNQLVSE